MPAHVQKHIDLIKPTVQFNHRAGANLERRRVKPLPNIVSGPVVDSTDASVPTNLANCDNQITLACLRALYGIDYTPVATDKNTFGIGMFVLSYTSFQSNCTLSTVEFTPQAFLPGDLDLFFR